MTSLKEQYRSVRKHSEEICATLKTEDYVVQPVVDVSPPKWHLGHTTWFFESFILQPHFPNYSCYDSHYAYVFNSYYETLGARVIRTQRGNLSRPTVEEVYQYRRHVDSAMEELLSLPLSDDLQALTILGLNHEEQHQELLATDIKYILGHHPLFPAYDEIASPLTDSLQPEGFVDVKEGLYDIGYDGKGFCFDNEFGRHKVFLPASKIAKGLVTNGEFLAFIEDSGYRRHEYWHSEGLDWIKNEQINAPLYWHLIDGSWHCYTASGIQPLNLQDPVTHVSYYEASAFATWKKCGCRQSLNGRRPIANSRGVPDGNGRPALTILIPVTREQLARSENTTANLWLIRWSCAERQLLRHQSTVVRATAIFFTLTFGGNTPASGSLCSQLRHHGNKLYK